MNKIKIISTLFTIIFINSLTLSQSIDEYRKALIDTTINEFNVIVIKGILVEKNKKSIADKIPEKANYEIILSSIKKLNESKANKLVRDIDKLKKDNSSLIEKDDLAAYLSKKIIEITKLIPNANKNKRKKTILVIQDSLRAKADETLKKYIFYTSYILEKNNIEGNNTLTKIKKKINEIESEKNIVRIIWLFVILNLFVFYILYFIKTKKIKFIEKEIRELIYNHEEISSHRAKINSLVDKNNNITILVNELESHYKGLKNKFDNIEIRSPLKEDNNRISIFNNPSHQIQNPKIVQYARCPESDGCFLIKLLSNNKAQDSLFKLTIGSTNNQLAKLDIIDNPQYQEQAINSYSQFLVPVCEFDKISPQISHQIIQLEPGQLTKNNNRWTITKKIKIKFQ